MDAQGRLWIVDTAHGRILRMEGDTFLVVADYDGEPNGMKALADSSFLIADYRRGLVRCSVDGTVADVCSRAGAEHLRAINDLTVAEDGTVYFTDQAQTGLTDPTGRVYRWRAGGEPEAILTNGPSPNGLVLSQDGRELFVAMTRANALWRVPLRDGPSTAKVGVFVQLSGGIGPDGLAMDEAGNLAIAHVGLGSVWLVSPEGEPLMRMRAPEGRRTTNIAYGGPDRRTLFITEAATGSVLAVPDMPSPGRPTIFPRSFP